MPASCFLLLQLLDLSNPEPIVPWTIPRVVVDRFPWHDDTVHFRYPTRSGIVQDMIETDSPENWPRTVAWQWISNIVGSLKSTQALLWKGNGPEIPWEGKRVHPDHHARRPISCYKKQWACRDPISTILQYLVILEHWLRCKCTCRHYRWLEQIHHYHFRADWEKFVPAVEKIITIIIIIICWVGTFRT